MLIFLGGDHAGLELKEKVKVFLLDWGYEVEDFGPHEFNEEDDFNDFVSPVARAVREEEHSRGIIFGGSGQGEAMQANRFKGVRAVVYYGGDLEVVKKSREHNDSNILSLGARFISPEEALEAIQIWLSEGFSEEKKYRRRNEKLDL
jgi:ribose 5-phosphate isomerase B